jgi:hypothetical protein
MTKGWINEKFPVCDRPNNFSLLFSTAGRRDWSVSTILTAVLPHEEMLLDSWLTKKAAQAPRFSHGVSGWYFLFQYLVSFYILILCPAPTDPIATSFSRASTTLYGARSTVARF